MMSSLVSRELSIRKSKDQWKGMAEVQTKFMLKCNNKSRWSCTSGFFFVGRYQCGEMKFFSKYFGSSKEVSIFAKGRTILKNKT